jgi:two-component system LytT family response regulator
VDDEPPARRDLRRLLEREGDVTVVRGVGNLDERRPRLRRARQTSCFSTCDSPTDRLRTAARGAYDDYAIRAFETNALDCLLKPVEPRRLGLALDRVRGRHVSSADPARGRTALLDRLTSDDWLLFRNGEREEFVRASAVACITAEGDDTRVGTIDGRTWLVHRSLRE